MDAVYDTQYIDTLLHLYIRILQNYGMYLVKIRSYAMILV